jgi:uncharacterized protein (DUF983 family)
MKKMNKWPLWPALVKAKCPRCRSFHGQVMFKQCDHCHLTYEIEPGYFYVAMLISYAMNVAEMVTLAVGTSVLTGSQNPWVYVIVTLSVALILSPFNFRYSRIMLLYWLTPGLHYHPEMSEDQTENQVVV